MCKKEEKCPRCGQTYIRGIGARIHSRECPGKRVRPEQQELFKQLIK